MQQLKPKVPGNSKGFNLVELIMVLVIVGILASMALPGFQGFIGNSKISATTNNFVSAVYAARSEAIKRGVRSAVCVSADSETANPSCSTGSDWTVGWIAFVDDNSNGVRDGGFPGEDLLVQSEATGSGFTITPDAIDASGIYFANNGTSIASSGVPVSRTLSIQFGDDEERLITVSANGRVSSKVVE